MNSKTKTEDTSKKTPRGAAPKRGKHGGGGLYVAEIQRKYKDRVYTTYLLRRSYREGGKVKQETLGNLSALPVPVIELVRAALRGEARVPVGQAMEIVRSRAHGAAACVLTMAERLGLPEILDPKPSRERDLALALIGARVLEPQSKLATSRTWTLTTLPEDLGVEDATEDDLYAAMDWLLERQDRIEVALAARHLTEGGLVLYDVSSSYVEGSHCPLAAFGHNRDEKRGRRQIVYGVMTSAAGIPVAVHVYPGNTADPRTVPDQIRALRERFRLEHVVLVGDRGMLTSARIDELRNVGGIEWVSSLRAPQIKALVEQGTVQPSLFDQRDLAEVQSPDYPGERLIVCFNPILCEERRRKRQELLAETEAKLAAIARSVEAGRLQDPRRIALRVGAVLNRYKVAKHFTLTIEPGVFRFARKDEEIAEEEQLDGFYVIRTNVAPKTLSAEAAVKAYKSLAKVERAFRTFKSVDLKVRPIYHYTEPRVRAHVLLCLLAYYVEWHLREAWKPLLYDDEDPGHREGSSPVAPAVRSPSAKEKLARKTQEDGTPLHSFATLLDVLATVVRNHVRIPAVPDLAPFAVITTPTPLQRDALERVGVRLGDGVRPQARARSRRP
jgi:transposase